MARMTFEPVPDRSASLREPVQSSATARRRIAIADVQNPLLRKGLEIWARAKGGHRLPSRGEIAPRTMTDILRNTALVRVIGEAEDFEFRIVGDAIVEAKGMSFKGMTTQDIDRIVPGYGTVLCRAYRAVCEAREPAAYASVFERTTDKRAYFQESVSLPLADDHETVDHLLVMGVYAHKYDASR